MRGEPKLRSRRSPQSSRWWETGKSISTLTLVALAPACGGSSPAAGVRPETGGNTGQGDGGLSGSASGGATGNGGGSSATGGASADAGSADALAPFDGGMCVDNASQQTDPNMTAAGGTFSGAL